MLAVGLVLPAGAARPRAGHWSGGTSQGRAIGFDVSSGKRAVNALQVTVRAACARGSAIVAEASFAGPFPAGGGSFRIRGGELQIRGEFPRRRQARGTLRWQGRSYDSSWRSRRCDSGTVRWSARLPGA